MMAEEIGGHITRRGWRFGPEAVDAARARFKNVKREKGGPAPRTPAETSALAFKYFEERAQLEGGVANIALHQLVMDLVITPDLARRLFTDWWRMREGQQQLAMGTGRGVVASTLPAMATPAPPLEAASILTRGTSKVEQAVARAVSPSLADSAALVGDPVTGVSSMLDFSEQESGARRQTLAELMAERDKALVGGKGST